MASIIYETLTRHGHLTRYQRVDTNKNLRKYK